MKNRTLWSIALVLAVAGGMVLVGCEKKQAPPTAPDTAAAENVVVVNTKCPIMPANAVDSKNVPANLVRTFKGQKVGFCCGACPVKWDRLTDEQRQPKPAGAN